MVWPEWWLLLNECIVVTILILIDCCGKVSNKQLLLRKMFRYFYCKHFCSNINVNSCPPNGEIATLNGYKVFKQNVSNFESCHILIQLGNVV